MHINLNQLRAFYLATCKKSITKAAKALYVTQPAVTMQIKSLERALDLKLLRQYGKALELTDAGRVLFHYAEQIFDIVNEMEHVVEGHSELSRGSLVIGTTRSFARHLMPNILSRFQERYPSIKVHLKEASSTSVAEGVISHEFNVGIIARIPFSKELSVMPYSKEEFCLVVPTTHRFAKMETVYMSDLAQEPVIIREDGSGSRYAILSMLESYDVQPSVVLEAESVEFIKEYVIQGRGISFLYKPDIRLEIQMGLLKAVYLAEGPIMVQTYMVFRKGVALNPPAKAFLTFFEGINFN
jgi:DNA-binding transcriptional LysR family regulator